MFDDKVKIGKKNHDAKVQDFHHQLEVEMAHFEKWDLVKSMIIDDDNYNVVWSTNVGNRNEIVKMIVEKTGVKNEQQVQSRKDNNGWR